MDKIVVHNALKKSIIDKIEILQREFDEAKNSLTSSTKSSVGDKHETSRAMIQLEQERIANQLSQTVQLKDIVLSIDPTSYLQTIQLGSLVETSNGFFYFSTGIGKIEVDGRSVFCMSPTTPLGQKLLHAKKGDSVEFNGNKIEVLAVT